MEIGYSVGFTISYLQLYNIIGICPANELFVKYFKNISDTDYEVILYQKFCHRHHRARVLYIRFR